MNVTELPFNMLLGMKKDERDGAYLTLPDDVKYTNHLGTIHAGALVALAESSSGEYLIRSSKRINYPVIPVIRKLESRFRKPCTGEIRSKVIVSPEEEEAFLNKMEATGRASITILVELYDSADVHVHTCKVEWYIVKK